MQRPSTYTHAHTHTGREERLPPESLCHKMNLSNTRRLSHTIESANTNTICVYMRIPYHKIFIFSDISMVVEVSKYYCSNSNDIFIWNSLL